MEEEREGEGIRSRYINTNTHNIRKAHTTGGHSNTPQISLSFQPIAFRFRTIYGRLSHASLSFPTSDQEGKGTERREGGEREEECVEKREDGKRKKWRVRVKRNENLHLALLVGNSLLPTSASPSHLQKDFCTKILRLSKMTPFTRSHSFPPFLSPSRLSYHPLSLPILSLLSLSSSLSLFLFSPFSLSHLFISNLSRTHLGRTS